MDSLDGLKTVIAVVETHSFTAASNRLGISKALVSKYVGEVEASLGARLFNRTTRRISLTDAGKRYYEQALIVLEQFSTMLDNVTDEQTSPRGVLRVSAPVAIGEIVLAPLLPKFLQDFPELKVELILTNNPIDLIEEGIDVRLRTGGLDDSSMIARHLQTFPLVLTASPLYLQQHGSVQTPEDLTKHICILDSNFRIGSQWPMIAPDGTAHTINVNSAIAVNSPQAVREIAIADGGVAMTPKFIVDKAIHKGQLVEILSEYIRLEFGLYAVYPHRVYVGKKTRCFIDFLLAEPLMRC
jgi:DNA-binding transcriptional LysR family regulator